MNVSEMIAEIDRKIEDLQDVRAGLIRVMGTGNDYGYRPSSSVRQSAVTAVGKRRTMTEEQKQRIRDAQARRWAKVRGESTSDGQAAAAAAAPAPVPVETPVPPAEPPATETVVEAAEPPRKSVRVGRRK